MEYKLPNDKYIKFWNDNDIYLGTQLQKSNINTCYGFVADNNYILVCEYDEGGKKPKIILFKTRKNYSLNSLI